MTFFLVIYLHVSLVIYLLIQGTQSIFGLKIEKVAQLTGQPK